MPGEEILSVLWVLVCTVAVLAPPETRLARIRARDGLDEAAALLRMRAQHDDAFYREHADAVLDNDGTPEELYRPYREIGVQIHVVEPGETEN